MTVRDESRLVWESIRGATKRERVLRLIWNLVDAKGPMACFEIERRVVAMTLGKVSPRFIQPRVAELRSAGLLIPTGKRIRTPSGASAAQLAAVGTFSLAKVNASTVLARRNTGQMRALLDEAIAELSNFARSDTSPDEQIIVDSKWLSSWISRANDVMRNQANGRRMMYDDGTEGAEDAAK